MQPEARSVQATSGDRRLTVTTKAHDRFRDVVVRTPRLLYHQTQTTHITFDLPGGKPRSASPVRVGRAYAAFTVWAWGDPGLADVRIVLPPKFSGDVRALPADTRDQLTSTSKDGRLTYAADDIADPESWYATVDIADHDALTDVSLDLGGEDVVIHAWPEDREWLDRVSSVVEASVPDLETAIGLPWPVDRELGISEVSSTQIEGYAGLYDSATDEIQISEDLDEQIIVHEAAHAWFNGGLFAQRWISEGLADEYASRVIAAEGRTVAGPDTVSSRDKAAFRLNDWPPPSRVDATTRASETYGYDASWTVIRSIVDDVGEAKMHDVFAAAAAGTVAYVGSGPAETSAPAVADWRRFLDLVEDVGGSTKAAGLIETWVVTGVQRPQLAARATARQRYDALVAAGSGWLPGIVVREPMSEWRVRHGEGGDDRGRDRAGRPRPIERGDDRARAGLPRGARAGLRERRERDRSHHARRADRDLAQGRRCGALGTRRAGRRSRTAGQGRTARGASRSGIQRRVGRLRGRRRFGCGRRARRRRSRRCRGPRRSAAGAPWRSAPGWSSSCSCCCSSSGSCSGSAGGGTRGSSRRRPWSDRCSHRTRTS